ncbi:MAG: ribosome recycling factor [Kistimonas sp.]|nr:ribosome recycling factor [Kistimonas sp.]
MIDEIMADARTRMERSLDALRQAFGKIRTGRAHPSLIEAVPVSCYGQDSPLSQVASITVEDARCLVVRVWDRSLVPNVEKAIMKSSLGLQPNAAGEVIRVPLPDLTAETRKGYTRQARQEAEQAKVAVRNIRRDALAEFKRLAKDKQIGEDDERRSQEAVQKITDSFVQQVDQILAAKENDLMVIQ